MAVWAHPRLVAFVLCHFLPSSPARQALGESAAHHWCNKTRVRSYVQDCPVLVLLDLKRPYGGSVSQKPASSPIAQWM